MSFRQVKEGVFLLPRSRQGGQLRALLLRALCEGSQSVQHSCENNPKRRSMDATSIMSEQAIQFARRICGFYFFIPPGQFLQELRDRRLRDGSQRAAN